MNSILLVIKCLFDAQEKLKSYTTAKTNEALSKASIALSNVDYVIS